MTGKRNVLYTDTSTDANENLSQHVHSDIDLKFIEAVDIQNLNS